MKAHPPGGAAALPAVSAVLLTLSLPPAPLALLAPFAFAPFAFHLARLAPDASGTRGAAIAGAVLGGLHGALLLHWLPAVALPLVGPFGALGAGAVVWGANAAFTAVGAAAVHRIARRGPLPLPMALAATWVLLGWLPAALPVAGLPWLGPEAALVGRPELLGVAGLVGGAGVAGLLALMGGAVGELVARRDRVSALRAAVVAAILAGAALYGYGAASGPSASAAGGAGDPEGPGHLRVAAVELEADPELLADRDERFAILPGRLRAVDALASAAEVDLVLWPESPTGSRDGRIETGLARDRVAARPATVLFGALAAPEDEVGARTPEGDAATPGADSAAPRSNRILLARHGAELDVVHEKRRLVPIVEWRPPWERGGTAPGPLRPPFLVPTADRPEGVAAGALICFEALFPGEARRLRRSGAEVLFLASNEGWLAGWRGGWLDAARAQHRAAAVLLAVEARIPVVRSAVGGRAGAWDPAGRRIEGEVRRIDGEGVLSLYAVAPAAGRPSPASRGGAGAVVVGALLLLGAGFLGPTRTERATGMAG